MKKIVGKFLKNNNITIMMWISILFIGTTDSIIPLIIYSVIIHALTLILIYGLYVDGIVLFPERLYRHTFLLFLFRIIESLVLLTVLILSKHWYTLCISLFYVFLVFVYMFDYKQQTEE